VQLLQQESQLHLLKANTFDPRVVTEFGKVTALVKLEQPLNASLLMLVTEEGIAKEPVSPEQPLNAESPMVVREEGIIKEPVKPEQ
jgi:hypothetical protein